jgi:zinc protease
MNKLRTLLFVFGALFLVSSMAMALDLESIVYPPLNKLELPNIQKYELPNGIRVYLLEDKTLPLIEASARVHGGTYLEPNEKVGVVDLMGDLMRDGGTEKWAPDDLDELLESLGGSMGTGADTIACTANIMMLSTKKELAMELLAEVMRRPRFDEARLEQTMVAYKSGIARRNDNEGRIASREFNKMIYGADSVYARHAEYKTLASIKRQDLFDYHAKIFRPEHVQLAIWGDIDSNEILQLVKKYFGDWERGKSKLPEFPKVDYKYDQRVAYVDRPQSKQSSVYLGHIGGNTLDKDNSHRIIMNNILGLGFGSRLFKEVRSKHGLCYSVYGVYSSNLSYLGKFFSYVGANSENTLKAISLIKKEIEKMQKSEPTAEELKSAKDRYLNSFVFNFDSKSQIIQRMVYYDFFGLDKDYLNKQKEEIEATSAADVLRAAQKNLRPDSLRILVVGNKKGLGGTLESLNNGRVTELDVSIPE